MNRDELIELGKKVVDASLPEEELEKLYQLFSDNVPHPDGANLFFYPENYNARRDDLSNYEPSVEEVVDVALSYKPIQL